jgi:hypothetical protein
MVGIALFPSSKFNLVQTVQTKWRPLELDRDRRRL